MTYDLHEDPPREEPSAPGEKDRLRQRMLRRFEAWLDEVIEEEEPPRGIDSEILEQLDEESRDPARPLPVPDLYSLWSSLTAMIEETRLQGRSFKQLHQELAPLQETVRSLAPMLQRCEQALNLRNGEDKEHENPAATRDEFLGVLMDLRDRMVRGRDTAGQFLNAVGPPPRGLRALLWPKKSHDRDADAIEALIKGYDLCREQIDEALSRNGVRPIDCVGRSFDPAVMKAVDIDDSSDAAEGTVIAVYRPGYQRDNDVLRAAIMVNHYGVAPRRSTPPDPLDANSLISAAKTCQ